MVIEALRKYRETEGLTQEAAAQQFGVARETWAFWELGTRRIGRTKLALVAEKTKIPRRVLRPDLAELLTEGEG